MNECKLFVQRIGLIGVAQLFTSLSGIILLPILTKNLSIEDYGIWAQINTTIGIFPGAVMLGLPYALVRFLPALKKKEEIQETFYSVFFVVLLTSGIGSFLIYLFSGKIASILFDNNDIIVKLLALIAFVECLNNLFIGYLRAKQQIKKYSSIVLLKTTFQIFLVYSLVISGEGILGASLGFLITSFLALIIIMYFVISDVGFRIPEFKNVKEYLNFGIPTVPGNFSNWIVNSSDRYVIGILLGTASVGYYSPGYSLGNLISIFITPLSFLLPSVLSQKYDMNYHEEAKKILSYSLKYYLTVSIPSVFGLSLLSESILSVLSTQEIASEGHLITPFIAISNLFFGLFTIFVQIIILEKKTKMSGKIWILAGFVNLGLNFLFVPYFGIVGAAITTLIAFSLALILVVFYSLRSFTFYMKPMFILKCFFASTVMSSLIIWLKPSGLTNIIYTIALCATVYFLILNLLGGFEKEEIHFVKKLLCVDF